MLLKTIILLISMAVLPSASFVTNEQGKSIETEFESDEDRLRFFNDGDTTVIDIGGPSGMGKATIKRKTTKWPPAIVVRLHLSGLESFKAEQSDLQVEWWVSSGGDNRSWVALRRGKDDVELDPTSPYFTKVRIVGGNGQVPLKGGYFEVPLPAKLLEGNLEKINLQWIDFYRR